MKCSNCAAPMKPVPDRNYHFCEFCGNFHFLEGDTDGIQIIAEGASNLDCPVCRTGLSLASLEGQSILHCTNCRGILTNNPGFGKLVSKMRGKTGSPKRTPQPIDPKEFEREVSCPRCGQRMETHPYFGPGNVVIDTCRDCRALWLDHGELTVVLES